MSVRRLLAAIVLLCLLAGGCGKETGEHSAVDEHSVTTISVWHPWGGTQKERLDDVVAEFNRSQDRIRVKALFTPNDLDSNQKFFTAVAANKPPDAIFVDGPQTAAWAEQGALAPLDQYVAKDGIKPEDYFAPCWAQNYYKGKVWALTYCADPNFALVWNKKVFREVGLDPERPPNTIEELDRYNDLITKTERGKIVRVGVIPWAQYGNANSLFTWGWAFKGSFYDPGARRITADDPEVVKALEWMVSYARKYDVTKINAFASGFGSREQNPLYTGQMAIQCLHIAGIEEIRQYAPNLDYGIGYIPAPAGGEERSSWVGGWCMGIPKGSKHPDEAWEFIRWCCRDPRGTSIVGKVQGLFPGCRKSPYLAKVKGKHGYGQFLRILEECRHQRPVMPAQSFYMGSLGRAVDYAIYGQMSPREALEKSGRETQAELDLRLAGR